MRSLRLPQGRASRGALAIMAGTASGQVLAVMCTPLLSRFYSPTDFGVFSVINALAMVLGTVLAGRYELAIPLPKSDEEARLVLVLGSLIIVVGAFSATIALWLLTPFITSTLAAPALGSWLIWVPLIAASLAGFRLLNQWALRQQRYAATARRNLISSVSTLVVQIAAGWRGAGAGGLVAGLGLGQGLGALSLVRRSGLRGRVRWSGLRRVGRRYARFPLILMPSGLLNASGAYLPLVLVAGLYGTTAAGWLGFTQRILAVPISLIGQAIAQVYLSELAVAQRTGSGRHQALFDLVTRRLLLLGGTLAVILMVLSPSVFPWVFGSEWATSGSMAQALAPALGIQLLASPLSQTLIVYERAVAQFAWDASRLLLVTAAVVVAAASDLSVVACTWAMSAALVVTYAASWELSRRTVKSPCANVTAVNGRHSREGDPRDCHSREGDPRDCHSREGDPRD
jgi:O-antigen/teichoic acid export membrane protein